MSGPFLGDFAGHEDVDSLSNGILYEHFAPTRDSSLGARSYFSYKECQDEWHGTDHQKGHLITYRPSVFGQVDMVSRVST